MERWFWYYLIFINLWTWLSFARDKRRAVRGQWRLPESYLLGLAALGGSLGGIVGMKMFRHKTTRIKFSWGLWLLLLLQTALGFYLYMKY